MTATLDRPALAQEAAACRRLWASVVLAALNDWWTQTRKAPAIARRHVAVLRETGASEEEIASAEAALPLVIEAHIARIRASALRYFRSRDGREVCALAGITADPERLADIATDPNAYERTLKGEA